MEKILMPRKGYSVNQAPPQTEPKSQILAEAAAKQIADNGQAFLAFDFAQSALKRFPDSVALRQISARALIRTGAFSEARNLLAPLCLNAETAGEETLGLLARVHKDLWIRTGSIDDGWRSRDIYLQSFRSSGGYWTGINAATMSCLLGDHSVGRDLARQVLTTCKAQPTPSDSADQYWLLATIGEAQLLLGQQSEAVASYRRAAELAGDRYGMIVSSLQQLLLMQAHGFNFPVELFRFLNPPNVVVFVGHMLDALQRPTPRFPAQMEAAVRAEIDRSLEALDARIGYSSAACGSDILFIEAMHERGAEVNIVMPFATEDFIRTSVAYAGADWVARFHNALNLASSVKFVTDEPLLNDTVLFHHMGRMFYGLSELRARILMTEPYLLAIWDGKSSGKNGGTGDIVSSWPDRSRLALIPIDRLLRASPPVPVDRPTQSELIPEESRATGQRLIKAMLFADIVGYSKLEEERTPAFVFQFYERVARRLRKRAKFANTWGDALFVVMDSTLELADYAMTLKEIVCETNWAEYDLPEHMSIRIALHAGPVFEGTDPMTGRQNYYGSHVNRAARIEPITIPGNIYASEQFVALLMIEQAEADRETTGNAQSSSTRFACDYIGTLALAKDQHIQALYHVHRSFS